MNEKQEIRIRNKLSEIIKSLVVGEILIVDWKVVLADEVIKLIEKTKYEI